MNRKLIYYSCIISFSGFLFGFDLGVISGINLTLKDLWSTSKNFDGFFILGISLSGTLVGALFSYLSSDKFGRKPFLFWAGVLFLCAVIGTSLSTDIYFFSIHRFLAGCAIGMFSIAAPIYISEISPNHVRGRAVGFFQLNIVLGIFVAVFIGYLLGDSVGQNTWRIMFGLTAFPILVFLILVLNVPESPRWLFVNRKEEEKVLEILEELSNSSKRNAHSTLQDLIEERNHYSQNKIGRFSGLLGTSLLLVILMAFLNQLSGIGFIIKFSPEMMGFSNDVLETPMIWFLIIGATGIIFTALGLIVIDSIGRKQLMLIGSIGTAIGLFLIISGYLKSSTNVLESLGVIIFLASYSFGQGIVLWVFFSEIFPNRIRTKGHSIGVACFWGLAAILSFFGPNVMQAINPVFVFAVSLVFMILQLIFVIFFMPETKTRSLELSPSSLPP